MKLYNTLSRQLEAVKPLNPPRLTLYTCGPTVYQEPHIGNWRTFIFYDTLHRVLSYNGYKVEHVLNITDVGHLTSDADEGEDKLATQAKKEHKTAWDIAEEYSNKFKAGLNQLNIVRPGQLPKATDHIDEQIALVKELEAKGFTYQISDGIYFDTTRFEGYGKLAGIKLEEQRAGARVEHNPEKKHHTDFALWKFSPTDQKRDMEWDSPWGKGFPGWHLECSALAMKFLGQTIDIHAGGVDHIGVHHVNEIAQAEAATGQDFAKLWIHAEHMMVDGQKMSKSLGNVYLLSDIEKHSHLMAFRLLMLSSHYRSQQNFTWEALDGAANNLLDIYAWADLRFQRVEKPVGLGPLESAMKDDLNSPKAVAALNHIVSHQQAPDHQTLVKIDELFGLYLADRKDITSLQKSMIEDREVARKAKDFKKSDQIRDQLEKDGLLVEDTPTGPIWRRTNL